eukprot:m.853034 g.853034  ORF g.853034 m.853034 type:complete len:794 (-) comp59606_c0_seq1:111-2492(-)
MALSCVRLMFRIASKISLESGFHRGLLMLARRESAGACIDWGRRATDLASAVTRCITLPQPSIATCSVMSTSLLRDLELSQSAWQQPTALDASMADILNDFQPAANAFMFTQAHECVDDQHVEDLRTFASLSRASVEIQQRATARVEQASIAAGVSSLLAFQDLLAGLQAADSALAIADASSTEFAASPILLSAPKLAVGFEKEFSLQVAPSAMSAWEMLRFEPVSTRRTVHYSILHASRKPSAEAVKFGISQLSSMYELCQLGKHEPSNMALDAAFYSAPPEDTDLSPTFQRICDNMCKWLSEIHTLPPEGPNETVPVSGVIYVVVDGSFLDELSVMRAAAEAYEYLLQSGSILKNSILIQLVAEDELLSLGLASQQVFSEYLKQLAMSVFVKSRPPTPFSAEEGFLFQEGSQVHSPLYSLAGFREVRSLVADDKTLRFQPETHTMHVAYSMSLDARFVAATWIDAEGEVLETDVFPFSDSQAQMFGGRHQSGSDHVLVVWAGVLTRILNRTTAITRRTEGLWRLVFCKVGALLPAESTAWRKLIKASIPFENLDLDEHEFGHSVAHPDGHIEQPDLAGSLDHSLQQILEPNLHVSTLSVVSLEEDATFQYWPDSSSDVSARWDQPANPASRAFVLRSPMRSCSCCAHAIPQAHGYLVTPIDAAADKARVVPFSALLVSLHAQKLFREPSASATDPGQLTRALQEIMTQLNALSWLTTDVTRSIGRRSNYPLHCVALARFLATYDQLCGNLKPTEPAFEPELGDGSLLDGFNFETPMPQPPASAINPFEDMM